MYEADEHPFPFEQSPYPTQRDAMQDQALHVLRQHNYLLNLMCELLTAWNSATNDFPVRGKKQILD